MTGQDDPVHVDLLAIHSRLGVIEGKVNLVARAERASLLELLKNAVASKPLIAQIYLVLDGNRTQTDILNELAKYGIETSTFSISSRVQEMERDHGMIMLVKGGGSKIYAKDSEMEKMLNLSKTMREWLTAADETIPEPAKKRRRRKQSS
jgi:hypothetical protein